MNIDKIITYGLIGLTTLTLTSACKQSEADASKQESLSVQFSCGTDSQEGIKIPVTIVNNSQQNKPLTAIYWNPKNNFFGGKWTPQQRCEEVSKRFQKIYERDGLKFITADEAKWISDRQINVICSVKEVNARCEEDDLLLTLETKDDPNELLKKLMAFREAPTENNALTRGGNPPQSFAEGKRVYYDFTRVTGEKQQQKKSVQGKSAF
jgi:hypothetical protein